MSLLQVRDVSIGYDDVDAVRGVTFDVASGEFVGLVGESGSGKSTLGFALTGLLRPPGRVSGGDILFDGTNIAGMSADQLRVQRRGGFAMVLQSGMNALNPVRRIGDHFADVFAAHGHIAPRDRAARARELMAKVELPASVLHRYPDELSGGMRQRVTIALALSLEPRLVVFDEPTTALDVLVQGAVMDTIRELQRSEGFTAILISHDLGLVLESTSRVLVMQEGRIVEDAPARDILDLPRSEYARMLLAHYGDPRDEEVQVPGLTTRGTTRRVRLSEATRTRQRARDAVAVDHVSKIYPARRRGEPPTIAAQDVSFVLEPGTAMALVGASGSGKSTLAKLITAIERPTSGSVRIGDRRIERLGRRGRRALHRDVQLVFQDPYAALNPLHSVEYTLSRPVHNYSDRRRGEARRRVLELLETVGLTPVEQFARKLPHELSGGQRQRVVIARALATDPQVIIADEPVSMLDVSLRSGILALLESLRQTWGVSVLYITHDLFSARLITDQILVMHDGRIVERGETARVLRDPQDDYTVRLLDAVPVPR